MPERFGSQSVAAQGGDPASTLELYRSAIAHRPTGAFEWVGCPNGTLVFRRGDVVCLVNVDAPDLELPSGDVVLATERVSDRLAPASAAWVRVASRRRAATSTDGKLDGRTAAAE
jgi:alpha-glucosidase